MLFLFPVKAIRPVQYLQPGDKIKKPEQVNERAIEYEILLESSKELVAVNSPLFEAEHTFVCATPNDL